MSEQRSAREVIEDHLRRRGAGDLAGDLAHNYAPNVVLLSRERISRGQDGVRRLAEVLRNDVPSADDNYDHIEVVDRHGFLEWTAKGDGRSVHDGADSYLIEDGRIVAQTIHYSTVPARSPGQTSIARRWLRTAQSRLSEALRRAR